VTDIDKVILKNIPTAYLQSLNWGFVDLCACAPHSRDAEGLGLCIVSGPVYVFIPEQSKGPFHAALCAEVPFRFFPLSARPGRFLGRFNARKIHIEHVLAAAEVSGVEFVSVLGYGMKSAPAHFGFVDEIVNAPVRSPVLDMVIDVGVVRQMDPLGVHLVRKPRNVDVMGMQTTHFPVFSSLQRLAGDCVPFGTILFQSPDPRVGRLVAVKVYSTLTHVVKALATANFYNLPSTLNMC